jgi:alkaline phosphatase
MSSLRTVFAVTPAVRGAYVSRAYSSFARTAPRFSKTASNGRFNLHLKNVARPKARFYSSDAPQKGSSSTLWILLAAAGAAGGAGYYYYTTSSEAQTAVKSGGQAAKAALHVTPKQEDYQKVYNTVAELLDEAGDYDGQWLPFRVFSIFPYQIFSS